MNYINEAARIDDFRSSFWELEIEGYENSKFRIEEVTLPFIRFQTEKLSSGENYFSNIEFEGEFSITIRETNELEVRDTFKEWQDSFFKDGTFISQGAGVEVGSEQDKIHKRLRLRLIRMKEGKSKQIKIVTEESDRKIPSDQQNRHKIEEKEIINNVLFSLARRKARNATDIGSTVVPDRLSKRFSQSGSKPELPTKKSFKWIRTNSSYRKTTKNVNSKELEEEVLKTFTFEHTKLLGFEPITFDYANGDPLKYSVSLIADYINEE